MKKSLVKDLAAVLEGERMGDMVDAFGHLIAYYAWAARDKSPEALQEILEAVADKATVMYALAEKEKINVN